MKKIFVILSLLFSLLLLSGCGQKETSIVASTSPVQQFAQAVCEGTGLEVGLVVSDAVSCVHDYTLSTSQMMKLEKAEVVIISGADLELFMEDALKNCSRVISCSSGIELLPGEEEGEYDPHVWLSPVNARIMTRNIAVQLSVLYPEYADTFTRNAEHFCDELITLQEDCLLTLSGLECRELVTFHDGFAYFAQAFGLDILAAIEEEAGAEASAKDLTEIVGLVEEHGLPAVFAETDGSRSAADAIARETGCKVGILSTGLGNNDYFETLRSNAKAVKEALS